MNQEANVRIVQDLYAAFGRGDIAAVLAGLDPICSPRAIA